MGKFQILCVTMHQTDFSKIREMNIHSDVVFANQADRTSYEELVFEEHKAQMITTETRGVGKNRNIGLLYADADICLFADDDVTYVDQMEQIVTREFDAHPDADIMIFHLETDDPVRKQELYPKTKKCGRVFRIPWGCIRVAFRLSSIKKANLWFTTLFGGGCIFPSGEDSMWLMEAKRKGLVFYVSDKTIGSVSFAQSTWFTGRDEKFFFSKGAYCKAVHPKTFWIWALYYAMRRYDHCDLSINERMKWIYYGRLGYQRSEKYELFMQKVVSC